MSLTQIFIVLAVTAFVVVTSRSAKTEQLYERGTDENIPTNIGQQEEINKRSEEEEEKIPPNKDTPDEQPQISERSQFIEGQNVFERSYGEDVGIPLHEEPEDVALYKKFSEEMKANKPEISEDLQHSDFYRQLDEALSLDIRGSSTPVSYGMDMELIAKSTPHGLLRPGQSTDTDSCNKVSSVPSEMRKASFYPDGIPSFYTKYTEAYGIPIIGSKAVTDTGLMCACYVARYLMAGRFDVRNAYYKLWGRIALIADSEQMTDVYEYRNFDKSYDSRVRGLGPTLHIPISSAGDDNMRCKPGDRYFDQNILLHEFIHGLHQMGAHYVIESFESRLSEAYNKMVTQGGKWKGTYADTNKNEYLATAGQFYHDSFRVPGKYLSEYGIKDQATLRKYDPMVTKLLDEMFPCQNTLVKKCDWKKCTSKDYDLKYPESVKAQSNCEALQETYKSANVEACADMGCYYEGNVVNYKGSTCKSVKCKGTSTPTEMEISQGKGTYNVYVLKNPVVLDMAEQKKQTLKTDCTTAPSFHGKRSLETRGKKNKGGGKKKNKGKKTPTKTNTSGGSSSSAACTNAQNNNDCGDPKTASQDKCQNRGCCWVGGKCKYGAQLCSNHFMQCGELAKNGFCNVDYGFMYKFCPLACGVCSKVQSVSKSTLDALCQNKNVNCEAWVKSGECSNNPAFMAKDCPVSCKKCAQMPKNPL